MVYARRLNVSLRSSGYVLRLRPGGLVAALPIRPVRRHRSNRRRAAVAILALGAAELLALASEALSGRLGFAAGVAAAGALGLAGAMASLYHMTRGPCDELSGLGWACSEQADWRRPSSVEGPYRRRRPLGTFYVLRVGLGDAVYEVLLDERGLRELEAANALPR